MKTGSAGGVPVVLAIGVALLSGRDVVAQVSSVDVAEVMRCFEATVHNLELEPPDRAQLSCKAPSHYFQRDAYPTAVVEQVLDGLEDLSRSSAEARVRRSAVTAIALLGHRDRASGIPIVPRLARLFDGSPFSEVRFIALQGARFQEDGAAAASFLGSVADRPQPDDGAYHFTMPETAVIGLASLGKPGRVELERLANDPEATHVSGFARSMLLRLDGPPM